MKGKGKEFHGITFCWDTEFSNGEKKRNGSKKGKKKKDGKSGRKKVKKTSPIGQ